VTKVDQVVERGADKLESVSNRMAAEGGVKAKLADELADDAAFLRKLKPSARPTPRRTGGGPTPFLVVGAALAAGVLIAKLIDWRSHAHPRV
jgi:hypothetical protein